MLLSATMTANQAAGQRSAGAKPAVHACAILTPAEVKKLVGGGRAFDSLKPQEDVVGRSGSSCTYANVRIQIDPFPFATIDDMRTKNATEWTSVGGVGDVAYLRNNGNKYAELFARARSRVITVQLDLKPPTETMAKARPLVEALAKALIAKLR